MRRLPLIWLILLLGPLTLSAQPQLWDTLSVYLVYPSDLPPPQHKAPKGYKPFYISHLGRHGSRYLSRPEHYSYPLETLSGAADAGLLTGMGESLLRDLSLLAEDAAGREGMLVPRGEEEHRGIMARMCRNYPEVFGAKNARIHAVSTESVRAIMSMSCALEELRVHYPAVRIERECGPRITRSLFGSEGRKKAGKKTSAIKKDIVKAAAPDAFMGRIFKNPEALNPADARTLLESVWECAAAARMNDALGIDLFRYLEPEDVRGCWLERNRYMYMAYGPSRRFGTTVLPDMEGMMHDIIDRADAAVEGHGCSADLRFGHDVQVVPVAALLGIENCVTSPQETAESLPAWWDFRRISPMAANIQLVFYRSPRHEDILVKVLLCEKEVRLRGLDSSAQGPYYRWEDVKKQIESNLSALLLGKMPGSLRVALIGDIQVPDEAALDRVRKTLFKDLSHRRDIDFGILDGDLVEERCDLLPAVKAACDSLPFPMFAVMGNHDRDGELLGNRTTASWDAVFGYRDTTFVAGGIRFVFLNSIRNSRVRPERDYVIAATEAQKAWLTAVLDDSAEFRDVVVTHGQLSRAHAGKDSLHAIFASHPKVFLVEAHTHRASRSRWNGVEEFNLGAPYALTWKDDPRTDLMNCGAPRGWFVADFFAGAGEWLTVGFNSLVPEYPGQAHALLDSKGRLVVNVYGGATYGKLKVDGKTASRLKEVCPETKMLLSDPVGGIPAKKIASTHIWGLDGSAYRKGDIVTVEYSDPFMIFTEKLTVR